MGNKASPSNGDSVVSVRGSVADTRFDAHLQAIYSLLHAKEGKIAFEVLAQLDAHRVHGIRLMPTQGLVRGEYNVAIKRHRHDNTVPMASDMVEGKSSLRKSEA